jgi:hypothetical protein
VFSEFEKLMKDFEPSLNKKKIGKLFKKALKDQEEDDEEEGGKQIDLNEEDKINPDSFC